jgi:hypothetical protein
LIFFQDLKWNKHRTAANRQFCYLAKPVEILRIDYLVMTFDSDGRIDRAERDKRSRLAMDVLPPYYVAQQNGNVVDARHVFAKPRYDNRYRWTPSPEMERAIIEAVFE